MSADPPTPKAILEAKDLGKAYSSGQGTIEVLNGLSLSLSSAESLSIRGESGSGKSTLLNLLAGIESADTGDILWNGESLTSISSGKRPARRARFLGYVFQAFYLIPELTALENVAIAGRIIGTAHREARARAEALLAQVGLENRMQSRPDQLSGGERQRTAIARALLNDPSVVLADEPTGNLDERTAGMVMDVLFEATRKHHASLLLVTHHSGFASQTARALHLEKGRLI